MVNLSHLGTYQPNPGNDSCIACPLGYECNSTSHAICEPGTISGVREMTCISCSAGTYQTESGNDTCLPCPLGHECTASSATVCQPGTISSEGEMSCVTCPEGNPPEALCCSSQLSVVLDECLCSQQALLLWRILGEDAMRWFCVTSGETCNRTIWW